MAHMYVSLTFSLHIWCHDWISDNIAHRNCSSCVGEYLAFDNVTTTSQGSQTWDDPGHVDHTIVKVQSCLMTAESNGSAHKGNLSLTHWKLLYALWVLNWTFFCEGALPLFRTREVSLWCCSELGAFDVQLLTTITQKGAQLYALTWGKMSEPHLGSVLALMTQSKVFGPKSMHEKGNVSNREFFQKEQLSSAGSFLWILIDFGGKRIEYLTFFELILHIYTPFRPQGPSIKNSVWSIPGWL